MNAPSQISKVRFGKVWVFDSSSLNAYGEYRTSAIDKNRDGPAAIISHRFSVTYTIPVGKEK